MSCAPTARPLSSAWTSCWSCRSPIRCAWRTLDGSRPDDVHETGTLVFARIYKKYGEEAIITLLRTLDGLQQPGHGRPPLRPRRGGRNPWPGNWAHTYHHRRREAAGTCRRLFRLNRRAALGRPVEVALAQDAARPCTGLSGCRAPRPGRPSAPGTAAAPAPPRPRRRRRAPRPPRAPAAPTARTALPRRRPRSGSAPGAGLIPTPRQLSCRRARSGRRRR